MRDEESAPEIALDIAFISKFSEAFDAEVVLNDDAVGRSCYNT